MADVSFADTIKAASMRAQDCRARLEQLRDGGPYNSDHVLHARKHLDSARRRAAAALERATAQNLAVIRARIVVDAHPDTDSRAIPAPTRPRIDVASFAARLHRLDRWLTDIWISYITLGGRCSILEVDAAIHGALLLPELDNMRLDQVLWECENGM